MITEFKSSEEIILLCGEEIAGRIDVVLTRLLIDTEGMVISRAKVQKYIEAGAVRVNDDVITKSSYKVATGDEIVLLPMSESLDELEADADVKFDIAYEDECLLVVNKPAGLVVHPGAGREQGTLASGLLARYGRSFISVGHPLRPGIVHRLDKETSGLMVVAKTQQAYYCLTNQFLPPRSIKRRYYALTLKLPRSDSEVLSEGSIDLPIIRHATKRTKMTARGKIGRPAITHWRLAESYKRGNLLQLELETGRTHQIRAHLEAMGAPIIGDELYGFRVENIDSVLKKAVKSLGRVALHAAELSFLHPTNGNRVEFCAEMPDDMKELISVMGCC